MSHATKAPCKVKAWVKFDGATGNINDDYNIAGVVRNAAGDYTVSLTRAFPTAHYSVAICWQEKNAGNQYTGSLITQAAGNINFHTFDCNGTLGDPAIVTVTFVGR